ncbi:MAG: cellulase family glycosylhydrolase [Kiritimatiellae bacterium]|nr:cellulase family glycosylhydrolase [Kiritimatiellia bacterium]
MPAQTVLPRWRGFNLPGMLTPRQTLADLRSDFRWIADWGFDWVRLPLSYHRWLQGADWRAIDEPKLAELDGIVELARQHGLHVCLNFHCAPGYSCHSPTRKREPFDLWKDREALEAFCFHWALLAERYKPIPSSQLSINLVNEPLGPGFDDMTREEHERVVRAVVRRIREVDPDRLIIADGVAYARVPCPELADLGIAQSCRAYRPAGIVHWTPDKGPAPVWPGARDTDGSVWDRAKLEAHYAPWAELARTGIGVHCGEGGSNNSAPHDVVLRWYRDALEVLTAHNIGHALWNFRGPFGILDSGRKDVAYENWHGHPLDRKLLELLREF